jgi:hypothetical protein
MQVTSSDGGEEFGHRSGAARDPDPEVGDRLGEVQGLDAVATTSTPQSSAGVGDAAKTPIKARRLCCARQSLERRDEMHEQ